MKLHTDEQKLQMLNSEPPQWLVEEYQKRDYIPIWAMEILLNEIFTPMGWKLDILKAEDVANEFVVSVSLSVHFERTGWITRGGIGAAPVRQYKGQDNQRAQPHEWYMTKITNALQSDAPSAYSHAHSNACEKLGNVFGVNLKRGKAGEASAAKTTTRSELEEAWLALPESKKRDPKVKALFKLKGASFSKEGQLEIQKGGDNA